MINVTKTFLPPIEEYIEHLHTIWHNNQLTNQGPLLKQFESNVSQYLGVSDFQFVTNGTLALQLALRALDIADGEIITTPFSYVATTSAILWERCKPVYVDIDPSTLTIDPEKIEAAITEHTKAILAVHVFGNPCDTDAIEAIAKKYNLKVIYDAAHAFGVKYKSESLLDFGDVSVCSFHATKLFHTIEGGGLVTQDKAVSEKIRLMKKFGHHGDDHHMLGINAKASEFQAAMGICNLKYVDSLIKERRRITKKYDELLHRPRAQRIRKGTEYNYAYYPLILRSEKELFQVTQNLSKQNIFPRRYFFPSLNTLPYLEDAYSCPVSEDISRRILCLPLYAGLEKEVVEKICEVLK